MIPGTPFLAVDKVVLLSNIEKMARHCSQQGISLRPHAKTHKSFEVAKLQLSGGASGITVATIGEAEVFARAGIKDIFIAYPLWLDSSKLARLKKLKRKTSLTLAIDSIEGAATLAPLKRIKVLIEIDSGHHRSGVQPELAGALAKKAALLELNPVGVFTFPGHSYAPNAKSLAVRDELSALGEAVKSFEREGIACQVVSTGSTPTAKKTKGGLITELRPGVYVFNDAQQLELKNCKANEIALWAEATVVSKTGRKLILDGGSKIIGMDRASWSTGHGRLLDFPEARITALSEHHATVMFGTKSKIPELGDRVRVVPNHVCNAVNLVDELYPVSDTGFAKPWKVRARGKNS
jgi:D-serine deaminase-like pyridoxal phosphate-dependent protein